jgi:hypothetical protein
MRHLGSLLAALVVAPAAWVLLALGQDQIQPTWDHRETLVAVPPWPEKAAFLAAAGLLIGLIASVRISPLGPLVAGVAYAGYGTAALWRKDVYDVLPDTWTIAHRDASLHAPVLNGTAVVIGAVLLIAVISVRRWQRWPKRTATVPAGAEAAPAGATVPTEPPSPHPEAPDQDLEGTGFEGPAPVAAPVDEAVPAGRTSETPPGSLDASGADEPLSEWTQQLMIEPIGIDDAEPDDSAVTQRIGAAEPDEPAPVPARAPAEPEHVAVEPPTAEPEMTQPEPAEKARAVGVPDASARPDGPATLTGPTEPGVAEPAMAGHAMAEHAMAQPAMAEHAMARPAVAERDEAGEPEPAAASTRRAEPDPETSTTQPAFPPVYAGTEQAGSEQAGSEPLGTADTGTEETPTEPVGNRRNGMESTGGDPVDREPVTPEPQPVPEAPPERRPPSTSPWAAPPRQAPR